MLNGATGLIERDKPIILYESQVADGYEKNEQVYHLLGTLGYSFFDVNVLMADINVKGLDFNDPVDLIPAKFPRLPQNTIAIHTSKLSQIEPGLKKAFI